IVSEHIPFLAEIYSRVATVRIRNVATVGGGLAHADPSQDPPPGLMTLGASVRLVSASGERTVPVEQLFEDYYETAIEPDEILTELVVPVPSKGSRSVYTKFLPRTADDYATVGVAVIARMDGEAVQELSVALGAVGATPIRAGAVESALVGQSATAANVADAAQEVAGLVDPLDDFRGSAQYKTDMAVVFTRRALESALGLSG
ncbi:MAG: FAD binding domain-containing protein, partial [Chloroflexi bacterium]|nr:FAD binding domain-containing protein [Chloroflexota bacterium]